MGGREGVILELGGNIFALQNPIFGNCVRVRQSHFRHARGFDAVTPVTAKSESKKGLHTISCLFKNNQKAFLLRWLRKKGVNYLRES